VNAVLLVGVGGALGAMGRYGAAVMFTRLGIVGFPWATMAVNIFGSLGMGILIGYLAHATPAWQAEARLLLAVGMLGGFTTFSAFSLDVVTLVERGQVANALGYAAVSVLASVLALMAGLLLTRWIL